MSGSGTINHHLTSGPLRARARPVAIVWMFVGIVICLLGLTVYSSQLLSAGRAFVSAESTWSKAQKDAVFYLTRFAMDRQPADYDAFERSIAVLDGDRVARIELEKPQPDLEVVRRGLTAGGVHPAEIDGLVKLYQRLHGFAPMQYILAVWARSDFFVRELHDIARELHATAPRLDAPATQSFVVRIHHVNQSLAPLENEFAQTLDELERAAQSGLVTAILVITGVLLIAGITLSRRFLVQNNRLQDALAESEAQLRHLVDSAPMPLLIARADDQRLLYLNDRALAQFGLGLDDAKAHRFADFHADPEIRAALGEALLRDREVTDFELHVHDSRGRTSWLLMSAQKLRYAGAECLLIALANIDDRKKLQEDMRRKALHDPLTGLPNRAMFLESLERAVHKARRRTSRFSVLFIDLDRFKEVNDTMGHQAGDALLKTVAERLASAVRQSDLVARLGGDEFVMLIEEHGGPEELMIVGQKVLTLLERPVAVDWREAGVSGSIGIASYPEDGEDSETLMQNADTAMYQAKERGRNNFQFYSPELNAMSHRRLELEKRVRLALEREEFFLEYQPEVELATGRVVAAEALLRWRDSDAGVAMPADFMPMAEETGTVVPIGAWVLDRALADLAGWQRAGLDVRVAVNLSPRQLQYQEIVEQVAQALQAHGVKASALRLELAEPTLTDNSDSGHRALRALRALGVEIALDNFGTAYSALGLLRGLPIQVVKIDKTLVSACPVKKECAALVQSAASMAHALGIRVAGQGIETDEQRRLMMDLGCDTGQGYFFAEPLDAQQLAAAAQSSLREPITA